jgi:hypothetical protein
MLSNIQFNTPDPVLYVLRKLERSKPSLLRLAKQIESRTRVDELPSRNKKRRVERIHGVRDKDTTNLLNYDSNDTDERERERRRRCGRSYYS